MVRGFESFQEHFKGYEDCYTIIGGTACDILMSEAALPLRATKDVDMILLIENRFQEFGALFGNISRSVTIGADGGIQNFHISTVLRSRRIRAIRP